jgi:hypothetical protein
MSLIIKVPNLRKIEEVRRLKTAVMVRYGRVDEDGEPLCSMPGCSVSNLDMLTIDHVTEGSGAAHRKKMNHGSGINLYRWLRRQGYPKGYQTLCFNHHAVKTRAGDIEFVIEEEAREWMERLDVHNNL